MLTDEAVAFSATANPICLRLLDARGVALHSDAECYREVEGLFVGEAELFGELMDPDLACHVLVSAFHPPP